MAEIGENRTASRLKSLTWLVFCIIIITVFHTTRPSPVYLRAEANKIIKSPDFNFFFLIPLDLKDRAKQRLLAEYVQKNKIQKSATDFLLEGLGERSLDTKRNLMYGLEIRQNFFYNTIIVTFIGKKRILGYGYLGKLQRTIFFEDYL